MPFTSPGPTPSREVAGSIPDKMSGVLPVSMWELLLVFILVFILIFILIF
jgi:hypothetical protein